jgi:hypothetical protein
MYKVYFKSKTPVEKWTSLGSYAQETQAITAALRKKRAGALLVRVTDKKGRVVYSG